MSSSDPGGAWRHITRTGRIWLTPVPTLVRSNSILTPGWRTDSCRPSRPRSLVLNASPMPRYADHLLTALNSVDGVLLEPGIRGLFKIRWCPLVCSTDAEYSPLAPM